MGERAWKEGEVGVCEKKKKEKKGRGRKMEEGRMWEIGE